MFRCLKNVCSLIKSSWPFRRPTSSTVESTQPNESDKFTTTVAVTEVSADMVSQTQHVSAGSATYDKNLPKSINKHHTDPSNSETALVQEFEDEQLPESTSPSQHQASTRECDIKALRDHLQLQETIERAKKFKFLDTYRRIDKDAHGETKSVFDASLVDELAGRNKSVLVKLDMYEKDNADLEGRLQAERERLNQAVETANAKILDLSSQLASERKARELVETKLNQNKEDFPRRIEDLETELNNTRVQMSNQIESLKGLLESDRALREADKRFFEQQRKRLNILLEQTKKKIPSEIQKKQNEVDLAVGAPVSALRIGKWADEDLGVLTEVMRNQMKQMVIAFGENNVVRKIEYLLNDELYKKYRATKNAFRSQGRSTKEILAFHGTKQENIPVIIKDGFLIGGINGHRATNGNVYGTGIYCALYPSQSFAFNRPRDLAVGERRMIGMRVLPGTINTRAPLFGQPSGSIGDEEFDSYVAADGTYVIRRACQVLPCFVIHY